MADSPPLPQPTDAVLGGTVPPPIRGAVLGGLESLKRHLERGNIKEQIAALVAVVNAGPPGQRLVDQLEPQLSHPLRIGNSFLKHYGSQHPVCRKLLDSHELAFEVLTVDERGKVQGRQPGRALGVATELGGDRTLEMVAISGGEFLMGSPKTELERERTEEPQHLVTVPPFYMGRHPVTQAQWQAVASLPEVNLALPPEPSAFRGDQRPVERVNWYQAREFCDRLSRLTGHPYRLPSEAQWEYACRAGTTTPFHFGETITTELANYRGTYSYGRGPTGAYWNETTPEDYFPANGFGLRDMHGNVQEWCLDSWHNNYEGAPMDGSLWESPSDFRVLRGGSWFTGPMTCRSASRRISPPIWAYVYMGLRVVFSG